MRIIEADCVDEALFKGLTLLTNEGLRSGSRAGEVLAMPCPVMTVNHQPLHRVSFNEKRDANPFFHLMEALWMLAGRNDATWLDQFVGDFSARFAEADGHLHGAYGFRWRAHFELEGGGGWPDQLEKIVKLLTKNPEDRRAVIAMWDPVADLGADKKDVPCNTHIYPRIRQVMFTSAYGVTENADGPNIRQVLDLTVCCRSNDAVWGAHGANAVHFSILQEYLAARIGVGVGKLYQLSNNYHVYTGVLNKFWPMGLDGTDYNSPQAPAPVPLVDNAETFDGDLQTFFSDDWSKATYSNSFFHIVACPMRRAYALWRNKSYPVARGVVSRMTYSDWSVASWNWFDKRVHGHLRENA